MWVELVVAGGDPPELLELADEPLDQVAPPVGLAVEVGVLGLVGPARDDRRDTLPAQGVEQPGGRVRLVGDHRPGLPARPTPPAGAQGAPLEQRPDADQVVTLPAGQVDRHGTAAGVAAEVELGREAAAGAAERLLAGPPPGACRMSVGADDGAV